MVGRAAVDHLAGGRADPDSSKRPTARRRGNLV